MSNSTLSYYSLSAQFPRQAHAQIKPSYITLIDTGNQDFFKPLAESFPLTFQCLTNCKPVQLMELAIDRVSGLGEELTDYLFAWSLPLSGNKSLILNIPMFDLKSEHRENIVKKYYAHLPKFMAGFFHHMDGGKIADSLVFDGHDFPNSYADWPTIHTYYANKPYLDQGDDIALLDELAGENARVVMTLRNLDFIVCLLDDAESALYLVRKARPKIAERLSGAEKILDIYFMRCLNDSDDKNITL